MRLTLFFLFLSLVQVFAVNTYSQSTRLSLNLKNTSIKNALFDIENKSEFYFLFNSKLVDVDRKVSIDVSNEQILPILNKLFEGQDVEFTVMNRQIVIQPSSTGIKGAVQQQRTIKGTVKDASGNVLPGVTIAVKGTSQGVISDSDGNFSLSQVSGNSVLIFSFVGMKKQEVTVGNQQEVNVVLEEEAVGVQEVVVTALGIAREKKGLGYAVQEIKGDELNVARETNFVNSLAGKVAGVNIVSGSAVGSSSRITMRC